MVLISWENILVSSFQLVEAVLQGLKETDTSKLKKNMDIGNTPTKLNVSNYLRKPKRLQTAWNTISPKEKQLVEDVQNAAIVLLTRMLQAGHSVYIINSLDKEWYDSLCQTSFPTLRKFLKEKAAEFNDKLVAGQSPKQRMGIIHLASILQQSTISIDTQRNKLRNVVARHVLKRFKGCSINFVVASTQPADHQSFMEGILNWNLRCQEGSQIKLAQRPLMQLIHPALPPERLLAWLNHFTQHLASTSEDKEMLLVSKYVEAVWNHNQQQNKPHGFTSETMERCVQQEKSKPGFTKQVLKSIAYPFGKNDKSGKGLGPKLETFRE